MNYLALKALKYYGSEKISIETIMEETREKIINTQNKNGKKKKRKKNIDNESEIVQKSEKAYELCKIQQERSLRIYNLLRKNLQNSILSSYHDSGFFWEHYEDVSGSGTRGHPFSGWTALIINIMAEI